MEKKIILEKEKRQELYVHHLFGIELHSTYGHHVFNQGLVRDYFNNKRSGGRGLVAIRAAESAKIAMEENFNETEFELVAKRYIEDGRSAIGDFDQWRRANLIEEDLEYFCKSCDFADDLNACSTEKRKDYIVGDSCTYSMIEGKRVSEVKELTIKKDGLSYIRQEDGSISTNVMEWASEEVPINQKEKGVSP